MEDEEDVQVTGGVDCQEHDLTLQRDTLSNWLRVGLGDYKILIIKYQL